MTSLESSEKGNMKTLSKCSVCGQEGHTKRSKECPQYLGPERDDSSDAELYKIPSSEMISYTLESSEEVNKKRLPKCRRMVVRRVTTKRSERVSSKCWTGEKGSDTSLYKVPVLANLKTSKLHTKRPKESPNSSASEKQDSSGATLYQIPSSRRRH